MAELAAQLGVPKHSALHHTIFDDSRLVNINKRKVYNWMLEIIRKCSSLELDSSDTAQALQVQSLCSAPVNKASTATHGDGKVIVKEHFFPNLLEALVEFDHSGTLLTHGRSNFQVNVTLRSSACKRSHSWKEWMELVDIREVPKSSSQFSEGRRQRAVPHLAQVTYTKQDDSSASLYSRSDFAMSSAPTILNSDTTTCIVDESSHNIRAEINNGVYRDSRSRSPVPSGQADLAPSNIASRSRQHIPPLDAFDATLANISNTQRITFENVNIYIGAKKSRK
ncbi:hypothetical protein N7456_006415 [Penicillium angulare]|uniref:Uncharacterized protein n=1 Tax=Penicillium angulare TaxID=116970 RepID=A0A9W9KBW8_9EURO|nr:hypothetical protein N7456_006415 [Penicillium angulare]